MTVTYPVTKIKMIATKKMTKMMIVRKKGVTVAVTQRKLRLQIQKQSLPRKKNWT